MRLLTAALQFARVGADPNPEGDGVASSQARWQQGPDERAGDCIIAEDSGVP